MGREGRVAGEKHVFFNTGGYGEEDGDGVKGLDDRE